MGAVVLGALLAGCGGSVADADSRRAAPSTTRPLSDQAAPFCTAVRANADAIRPLNGLNLRTPEAAGRLTTAVQAARMSGTVLLNAAPDVIRTDVQRTVDALEIQLKALLAAGGDTQVAARDPQVMAQVDSPDLTAAAKRVATYVNQNCAQVK